MINGENGVKWELDSERVWFFLRSVSSLGVNMTAPAPAASTLISKENIRVAAETVGVELADDVIRTLTQEVEYRVREITQVRFDISEVLFHL